MLWATSRTRSICGRCFLKILDISKVYFIILSRYFTISYLSVFYHSILHIKIIYYFLPIIINNINSNKFKIQKPQQKRKKKKTSTNQQTKDEKMLTQTQPTNQPNSANDWPKTPAQPTHNPHNVDPKRRPKTHIETHLKSHTHNPIKRDLKVGGKDCGCRRRGLEHEVGVVENEATRLAARTGVISGEDWRVILSNFLEQGGEERDKEW